MCSFRKYPPPPLWKEIVLLGGGVVQKEAVSKRLGVASLGFQVRLASYSKLTADLLSKLLVASVLRLLLYLAYTLKMPEEGFKPEEKTEPIL